MIKVQQDNVDNYLEDIVIRAGERAADQEARHEIKEHAADIDRVAEEIDRRFVHARRRHFNNNNIMNTIIRIIIACVNSNTYS